MHAGVAEPPNAELGRLAQLLALIQALADSRRGPRDQGEVGKANLTSSQRHTALAQAFQVRELLADTDPIAGGATAHVAVGLDPRDGAVESLLVVLIGLGEVARHVGELDLEKIDRVAEANKSFGEDLPGYFTPAPHCHKVSIRTSVRSVKYLVRQDNWQGFTLGAVVNRRSVWSDR